MLLDDAGDHYSVLGVEPHVGAGQLQAAYRFTLSLYAAEGTAWRGFLTDEERLEAIERTRTALAVLSDPIRRAAWDRSRGATAESTPSAGAPPRVDSGRDGAPLAGTDRAAAGERVFLTVPPTVRGADLRELRERRGATLAEIAAMSKVSARFLESLENDAHDRLPGRVFARGFLIEYARALGVNEMEVAERYLRQWTSRR